MTNTIGFLPSNWVFRLCVTAKPNHNTNPTVAPDIKSVAFTL